MCNTHIFWSCVVRKGRASAAYLDMTILDSGPLSGSLALVDPIKPSTDPEYIQRVLNQDEALEMLRGWVHMARPDPTGSYSAITMDGRRWLKETTQATQAG